MVRWAGKRLLSAVAFVCAFACVSAQGTLERDRPVFEDDEIVLSYDYVWGGSQAFGLFMPVRFDIENPLDDDEGILTIDYGTFRMHYPVQMPSRTLRSFIAYVPVSSNYEEPVAELRCRQARIKVNLRPFMTDTEGYFDVALISDSPALIAFLRTMEEEGDAEGSYGYDYSVQKTRYRDYAVLPGRAPDRAIGYDGMDLVILGEGAERLTDAEVAAVQRHVLAGGTVLFLGGAVSPVLRDLRWEAFVPGTGPTVVNLQGSRVVSEATGVPMDRTFSATRIAPVPGTSGLMEDGVPIFWYRKCGLGLAVFWAFDPFQAPFQTYAGRQALFADTLKGQGNDSETYLTEQGAAVPIDDYGYRYGGSYYADYEIGKDSVFTVSMPPTLTVFLILAAYFVCVVPLNFVLLARAKRGELAWVTSPLIGLAFAGVFFMIARDLYGVELSRATRGVLVAHQGTPVAYAVGNQEMFFPSGGRYDLGFSGMEAVSTPSDFGVDSYGGSSDTGFSGDLIDVGQVLATRVGVSNLSFREIHFRQAVDWPYALPLRLELREQGSGARAVGTFFNDSPYALRDVSIWIGRTELPLEDVEPGATVDIDALVVIERRVERYPDEPPVGEGQVALTADLAGFQLGSTLGTEQGRGTRLFFTFSGVSGEVLR